MADFEALIGRIALNDREAFAQLYNALNRRVYFYILGIVKDESAAQDILADTFTEVWKSASRFEGRSKALTWIIGIARNLSLKFFNKARRFEDIDDHPELSNGKADEFTDRFADTEYLKAGLERLSWKHREVLHLAFFEGFSYDEISRILSIPVNTVKTRVFHAKKALRWILTKELANG